MYSKAIISSALLGVALAAPQWGPPHRGPPHHTTEWHPTTTHHTTPGWHSTTVHHTTVHHTTVHHTTTTPNPQATLIHADFDDALPVRAGPVAAPLGRYDELLYSGVSVAKLIPEGQINAVAAGIVAESSPNVIYYDADEIQKNGSPFITSSFAGSNITSFSFESFYFGCANVARHVTGSSPVNCSVTVDGYSKQGSRIATQTFRFVTPEHKQTIPMKLATLSSAFQGLSEVSFDTTAPEAVGDVATLLDNFLYSVVYKRNN